jgi:site-specific DNA-adenine methylase
MFSYYGSKSKLVNLYPAPEHDLIIEPFAGSARYALQYFDRAVHLYDPSHYVCEVWRYLIAASPIDVLGLPDVPSKVHLDTIKSLSDAERYLIGFHLCRGKAKPRTTGHGQNSWDRDKQRIAREMYKVKHWKIFEASYITIPNRPATWYIDPPYQAVNVKANGDRYPHNEIDYDHLAKWTLEREGQVIACEMSGATWLPFEPLKVVKANTNNRTAKSYEELVWTRRAD